ncbi:MarR family transcriptional regulator [Schaalia sp. 19OD2882]|uniref:MarR family winged helix-turn-helix transcriptional regulator n=1 Tax=Schaalia sp. 19OD2882 TaxID=2794089 RepID=UPI001C1EA792|nr:MarR family transcriptional regulator [Schaalia sp. 19OD2882]QWW20672.1 MarR family transcriptional regulator [Schaalia sp. 19OD2882]
MPSHMNLTEDSSSENGVAWRAFFRTLSQLTSVLETRLKRHVGLSLPDYHVLLALWEAPNQTLRMGQLAESISFSPSRVSYLVTHLERDGLVIRETSAGDKRGFDATLTESGRNATAKATRIHQDLVREQILDGMDEKTLGVLVDFFGRLESSLDKVAS